MSDTDMSSYEEVNGRLKEIADLVADDSISLDAALDLFEEAVRLGVRASSLIEEDIATRNAQQDQLSEDDVRSSGAEDGAEDGTAR